LLLNILKARRNLLDAARKAGFAPKEIGESSKNHSRKALHLQYIGVLPISLLAQFLFLF
jgi:hypothetical protein